MFDKAEIAGIAAIAPVVAQCKPAAGRYPERTEMVTVPILFIKEKDLFVAEAGRKDIAFAIDMLRTEIVLFERDIERVRIGRDSIGLLAVVSEAGAVVCLELEDVFKP